MKIVNNYMQENAYPHIENGKNTESMIQRQVYKLPVHSRSHKRNYNYISEKNFVNRNE